MKRVIAIFSIILSGCASTIPVTPDRGLITITPDMVQECEELRPFVGKTEADLINFTGDLVSAYQRCDAENHGKAELIRRIFGVKVEKKSNK
jgi:hypothetical protein